MAVCQLPFYPVVALKLHEGRQRHRGGGAAGITYGFSIVFVPTVTFIVLQFYFPNNLMLFAVPFQHRQRGCSYHGDPVHVSVHACVCVCLSRSVIG